MYLPNYVVNIMITHGPREVNVILHCFIMLKNKSQCMCCVFKKICAMMTCLK